MKTSGHPLVSRSTITVDARRGTSTEPPDATIHNSNEFTQMDLNAKIAALLRDFAAVQTSKQKMWGYKRAAAAVLALEEPIETLLQPF